MGQSPLLDPHRRQEARRDGGKVDDRRRYPEHTAPTRPEKAGPAAWNGGQGRGLSGQGRRTPGKRPEFDSPQRARPVPRVVGHRRSAGRNRSDGRWRSSQMRAFTHQRGTGRSLYSSRQGSRYLPGRSAPRSHAEAIRRGIPAEVETAALDQARSTLHDLAEHIAVAITTGRRDTLTTLVDAQLAKLKS